MSWASKPSEETPSQGGKIGEWIFTQPSKDNRTSDLHFDIPRQEEIKVNSDFWGEKSFILSNSLTLNVKQGDWRTPTEFLCCPSEISDTPLEDYFRNLEIGKTCTKNTFGESKVLDFALSEDKKHLWVLSVDEQAMKPWAITEIIVQDSFFIHLNRHTYFEETGGRKYFTLAQGKEWTGGDCMDDYC